MTPLERLTIALIALSLAGAAFGALCLIGEAVYRLSPSYRAFVRRISGEPR